ncbi:hypothetical protein K502DRAFT_326405 [Neoconidiobolus thromboides FSU 785]|nr:hypothetical protein K502DRAFT_326405 [Neoconidiobolus thromboides FSU 785]
MEEANTLNDEYNALLPSEVAEMQVIPVAPLYARIRSTVKRDFDTAYTYDQLTSPEIRAKLLVPIVNFLLQSKNKSAIFCCLLNSWDFKRDEFKEVGMNDIYATRALACELLAVELLGYYGSNLQLLIHMLTFEFSPYQGIEEIDPIRGPDISPLDDDIRDSPVKQTDRLRFISALGIACRSHSKVFSASPLVQIIIQKIWRGDIVFYSKQIDSDQYYCAYENSTLSPQAKARLKANIGLHSELPNRFGGIFRASRLRVPVYQNSLNIFFYFLLIFVYTLVLNSKSVHFNWQEGLLLVFTIAFTIDELRQLNSSGIRFYFQSFWNFLDIGIYSIFITYFILRLVSISSYNADYSTYAHDLLSCNAIFMWPRVLMILDGYPFFGILIITLKHMFMDATLFFTMAIIIFIGFFQAFMSLDYNSPLEDGSYLDVRYTFMMMTRIFFGSAYIGFDHLGNFRTIIGSFVMFLYIALTALFLMTILMSIFNESFSTIYKNATKEHLFNFTTKVMEFIESEYLFPFVPPFNLVQILFVYPFHPFLSHRAYAFLNRTLIRIVFGPFLILIYLYERVFTRQSRSTASILMTGTRGTLHRSISLPSHVTGAFKVSDSGSDSSTSRSASEILQEHMGLLMRSAVSGIDLPASHPIAPAPPPPSVTKQIQNLEAKCQKLESKLDKILSLLESNF